jgi:hypothetical protein
MRPIQSRTGSPIIANMVRRSNGAATAAEVHIRRVESDCSGEGAFDPITGASVMPQMEPAAYASGVTAGANFATVISAGI